MKLIFVYNAKKGKLNTIFDIAHKIIKPDTYKCSLCSLTYGILLENKIWKKYREKTNNEIEFYHSDEFEEKYNKKFKYPIILERSKDINVLLSDEDINSLNSVEKLIKRLKEITN